jgi:hypothetical protein
MPRHIGCRPNLASFEAEGAARQTPNLNYLAGFPGVVAEIEEGNKWIVHLLNEFVDSRRR